MEGPGVALLSPCGKHVVGGASLLNAQNLPATRREYRSVSHHRCDRDRAPVLPRYPAMFPDHAFFSNAGSLSWATPVILLARASRIVRCRLAGKRARSKPTGFDLVVAAALCGPSAFRPVAHDTWGSPSVTGADFACDPG